MNTDGSTRVDVVIVGAGFAGLYMLHRLRTAGRSATVVEAGGGIGGTWYWNRYPGARCDIDSLEYSYQFSSDLQKDWEWSERYATQPEILRYLEHVADRFDLRRDIRLNTTVVQATFEATSGSWSVTTAAGDTLKCRFLVMATGCLSSVKVPSIDGLDTFSGEVLHTGKWPHDGVDLSGRRVAVIGTGSSGIQVVPKIAEQAESLVVFQRTANYAIPARHGPVPPERLEDLRADPAAVLARQLETQGGFGADIPEGTRSALTVDDDERRRTYEDRWRLGGLTFTGAFTDILLDPAANETAAEFVRAKIRDIVDDPNVAELLSPKQVLGCKRLCLDSGYYEAFNRPGVRLVDLRESPIEVVTPSGITTVDEAFDLDTIVLATGFDAMTGSLLRVDIRGVNGETLRSAWAAGPRSYLGLAVPGFPNMFIVAGPGSPSVLSNMVRSIEHHVDWIAGCIEYLNHNALATIEARADAADAWVAHVNAVAGMTLLPTCNSWYLGPEVSGKPRLFMPLPGLPPYIQRCTEVERRGYEGFDLR